MILGELLQDGRNTDVLERFNCKTIDQLYVLVGVGGLKEKVVIHHLIREYEKTLPPPTDEELIQNLIDASEKLEKNKLGSGIIVKGVGDTAVRFARCCGPLPGDEILGFVTRGRGLTVHRTDCINIIHMDEFDRRRLIGAEWHKDKQLYTSYHTEMRITGNDRNGLLADISRVLTDEKVKINSVHARSTQSEAVFLLSIEIVDAEQLVALTKKLKNVPGVCEITRVSS
jgi:GTP pyrophosphokinase